MNLVHKIQFDFKQMDAAFLDNNTMYLKGVFTTIKEWADKLIDTLYKDSNLAMVGDRQPITNTFMMKSNEMEFLIAIEMIQDISLNMESNLKLYKKVSRANVIKSYIHSIIFLYTKCYEKSKFNKNNYFDIEMRR